MRLIDADEALKLFRKEYESTEKLIRQGETHLDSLAEGFMEAAHIIKYVSIAVDAVPVVRCRDCENSWEDIPGRSCSYGPCVDCCVPDDFYCANGEPKKAKTN